MDFTTVIGLDKRHLQQMAMVWPTWKKHKPSLLAHPMLIFFDRTQVRKDQVLDVVDHPDLHVVSWPFDDVVYEGAGDDKWSDPQRYKMLAGFVHVPAMFVRTDYWLKIDTDTVAVGKDNWIDENWFQCNPAIVSHKWTFTKPANQMQLLDEWVDESEPSVGMGVLKSYDPLHLIPLLNADRIGHRRIISWVGFFNLQFTVAAAYSAVETCGRGMLPVPSQDGYLWYYARRTELPIKRLNMKHLGWEHWSSMGNVKAASRRALGHDRLVTNQT